MTTAPIDPSAMAPDRPRAPAAVVAMTVVTAALMAGHLALSVATRDRSPIWAAFPTGCWIVHVAGIVAAVGLGLWTLFGLLSARSEPARPAAALGRYAVFAGVLAIVCSWPLDSSLAGSEAAGWAVRLTRLAVGVGVPLFTLYLLGSLSGSRAAYGRNVAARVGDFLLQSVTRDGAIVIILMITALLVVLFNAALPSIKVFGAKFLVTSEWRANELPGEPQRGPDGKIVIEDGEVVRGPSIPAAFGALPVIYGTAASSAIALLIAVPLSFGAALFLVRISPDLKPITVKAGVAGLLLVLLLPMLVVRMTRGGGPGGTINMPLVLVAVVVGIVLAEILLWLTNGMIDRLRVAQSVPPAYEAAAHVLLGVLTTAFAMTYLGLGLNWALLFGAAASAVMFPLAAYFTAAVSFLVEFLAAIPSIAYGLWGMQVLALFLQSDLEPLMISVLRGFGVGVEATPVGRDLLNGGLVLGIMIIPIITAISRDVLKAVPGAQVEGTTALGATWWQSSVEMLKFSRSALFGAVMLGLARAAGETMAVTMVIGNNPQINWSLFAPAQTMASLLANEFGEAGGLHFSALMYVAFILLVMSLVFNVVARYFVVGKGSRTAAAH